jgi:hypothetical protein
MDFMASYLAAGPIHVYSPEKRSGIALPIFPKDKEMGLLPKEHTEGAGTVINPYRWKIGYSYNNDCPRLALVSLWYHYRPAGKREVLAEALGNILVIFSAKGITALDGRFMPIPS